MGCTHLIRSRCISFLSCSFEVVFDSLGISCAVCHISASFSYCKIWERWCQGQLRLIDVPSESLLSAVATPAVWLPIHPHLSVLCKPRSRLTRGVLVRAFPVHV